jgi:pimeloyl-ACP methyl ester carboxylesterase
MAVKLLHDFLTWRDRPLHLISHSTSGLVGLMYARRYPHKVSSLGLLAVGWLYAINLQAHYYTHLSAFPWSSQTSFESNGWRYAGIEKSKYKSKIYIIF